MKCAKCGAESLAGRKFCTQCGSPLAANCPRCGAATQRDEKFCGECGAGLETAGAAAAKKSPEPQLRIAEAPAAENLDGERKTVTALFVDIRGSMEMMEDIDPEEARAVVDPALKVMIDAINRYGGYVVQSTGDGVFALFGAPLAHEDHPQRALYAAIRMQDEMQRYSAKLREAGHPPLEARVGVNTGEVVIRSIATAEGHTEYTPIGHSTSLASRMQVLAPSGSIAATEQVKNLCEGYFLFKLLGPTTVKGVTGPLNVYQVTGVGPLRTHFQLSARRGLTRFVGREPEMESIARAAQLAKAEHGQIVGVVAEPGVGKSRLFYEFKVRNQSVWMVLEASSISHGKASAYLPLIDLLQSYFDIKPEDDFRKRREKVTGRLLALDRTLEDSLPYLFGLLGIIEGDDSSAQMDAQVRRRRTLDAIIRILSRESANQPLMLIFEDLHWIDDETQSLLNLLSNSITNSPIMLLVNYRPEYRHEWGNQASYTQLRLQPLGHESADEMLNALLGESVQVAQLKRLIIEKTEGTPFFIEETVQALFEDGTLTRNGQTKVTRPLDKLHIPATVQAMIASRIDHLTADEKQLMQTLSVLGMEFSLKLAAKVIGQQEEDLLPMCSHLQQREHIYEQLSGSDIAYTFKHALTHDVAYNSLLLERRKVLHGLVAQALESMFESQLDDHLGAVAHHYGRSGNVRKAVEFLRRAGEHSAARAANEVALTNFDAALELLKGWPEGEARDRQEASLQLERARASYQVSGWASLDRERSALRALELGRRLGEKHLILMALGEVWGVHLTHAELARATELVREMITLADGLNDVEQRAHARVLAGWTLDFMGEFTPALEHLETAMALSKVVQIDLIRGAAWMAKGLAADVVQWLGYPDRAHAYAHEFLAHARRSSDPGYIALASDLAMELSHRRRESKVCRELAESVIATGEQYGFRDYTLNAKAHLGWVAVVEGDPNLAFETLGETLAELRTRRLEHIRPQTVSFFVQACLASDRLSDGIAAVEEGLLDIEKTGAAAFAAELNRLKGELLIASSDRAFEAQKAFQEAIKIARRQRAKWHELRATTSLARLLRDTNRNDEARAMLADIYNWFTEGFDTADLKDAKALLGELSA
jgi:class 3 adenylate cyclase/tetratricopeptide (TPR) repeat protein